MKENNLKVEPVDIDNFNTGKSPKLHSEDSKVNSMDVQIKLPKEKKEKCDRKRKVSRQRYRDAWEDEPEFQTWLHSDPTNECRALCYACNASFVSDKSVIRNHANGRKHKRLNAIYNSSTTLPNSVQGTPGNIFQCKENSSETTKELRYVSNSTLESTPAHQTIVISALSSGSPTVNKSDSSIPGNPSIKTEQAKRKLTNFLRDLGISKHNAYKFNHVVKQCFSDSEIAQSLNLDLPENDMSRRVPLTCRDPFFRDLDRDFFGDSGANRQNWSESPTKLFDQHFATGLWPDEVPTGTSSLYLRSRRTPREKSGFSIINETKDKFTVLLEVPHFLPDELKVRVTGNVLEIEGKHGERQDDHGSISRQFTRKYNLPEDAMVDLIGSSLSAEGILTIETPRKPPEPARPAEREVPIQKMAPK